MNLMSLIETMEPIELIAWMNSMSGYCAIVAIIAHISLCYLETVENESSIRDDVRVPILIVAGLFFISPWKPLKVIFLFIFIMQSSIYAGTQFARMLLDKYNIHDL